MTGYDPSVPGDPTDRPYQPTAPAARRPSSAPPATLERLFGRQRLRMVTGPYAEVFREAAAPGERRRYTKRFLAIDEGDFREWTQREWRLLARLVGHGVKHVPEIVQFDRSAGDGGGIVQTFDAGVTIDHWERLLPVSRDAQVLRHVFQDCAHWWALSHHLLIALHEVHRLQVVHLDLKADNVCIPLAPPDFDPHAQGRRLFADFGQLSLIDFAFSTVSGEPVANPLPIGWQQEYPYQSPRLLKALLAGRSGDLQPTQQLDWRCDMYSLATLLQRYLPGPEAVRAHGAVTGWTDELHVDAKVLILKIRDAHDREPARQLPHEALIEATAAPLRHPALAAQLDRGWHLAPDWRDAEDTPSSVPLTPVTRIEPPARRTAQTVAMLDPAPRFDIATRGRATAARRRSRLDSVLLYGAPAALLFAAVPFAIDAWNDAHDEPPAQVAAIVERTASPPPRPEAPAASTPAAQAPPESSAPAIASGAAGRSAASDPGPMPDATSGADAPVAASGDTGAPAAAGGGSVVLAPAEPVAEIPATLGAPDPGPGGVQSSGTGAPVASVPASSPQPDEVPRVASADAFTRRADVLIDGALPKISREVAARLGDVLDSAEDADSAEDDRRMLQSVRAIAVAVRGSLSTDAVRPGDARVLNDQARDAFWNRRDVRAALALQKRAFGANPNDAEVAGNLAFYLLKNDPPDARAARELALYALALATASQGVARTADWGNLAVASSLIGAPSQATKAMYVFLASSKDINRACRAALSAYASHGPALRAPAQAMLERVRERGIGRGSPFCAWPPDWSAGVRFP